MARRSQGCCSCRRKKIKCDEGRPVCARCLHSKSIPDCVYLSRYQFRDEGPKFSINSLQDSSSPQPRSRSQDSLRTELKVLSTKIQHGGMVHKFQLIRSRSGTPTTSNPGSSAQLPIVPSLSKRDELASAFVDAFQTTAKGYELRQIGNFMFEIPSRLGCNPALDAAVTCLLQSHSQLLRNAYRLSSLQYQSPSHSEHLPSLDYMLALRKLQEVIEHPTMGTSSETVCAMIIMSLHEMIVAEKRGSQYLTHASASTKLIVLRGPEKVTTEFEKDLLRSQRGHMIMQAFIRREDCVLLCDGWRDIRLEKSPGLAAQAVERLFQTFSRMPSLLKLVRNFKNEPSGVSSAQHALDYSTFLQNELASIRASVQLLLAPYKELAFDMVSPFSSAHDAFPTVFLFHTPKGARFNTWYWTASLIINVARASILQHNQAYNAPRSVYPPEVDEAACNICMSCDYAENLKPLGAQFIQLPLVCAYFVSNKQIKNWILDKLNVLCRELHIQYTTEYLDVIGNLIMGD